MTFVEDLDTPVPVVDVRRLEANIARMAGRLAPTGVAHRPHAKAHKTREIAEHQLRGGAAGLTVAKVGEAEAYVAAGFEDLFIAYPVVGRTKLLRLIKLLERTPVSFTIDSAAGARGASEVLERSGHTADVVMEIEAGAGRTGVPDIAAALELASLVAELPGIRLTGVMAHAPGYVPGLDAQRAMGHDEGAIAVHAAQALRAAGHTGVTFVTAGCTPTSPFAAEVPGVTHVRAGNYVFYDRKQVQLGVATLDDCALTVLATVVSRPRPRRYVVDAGIKALAGEDYGWGTYGVLLDHPEVPISWAAEEHGVINVPDDVADPGLHIGDRVRIVPNHACGVPNMHDELVAIDGERVVDTWRVIARGRVR